MKLITFTVPCYNSQDYMEKCIESLVRGGEDVEIIIVNDGSTDSTCEIAEKFAEKYPSIVRVIHQENGGHGEGLNTGIKNAKGLYFKVVDSDDWLDEEAYKKVLLFLKEEVKKGTAPDLLITNFVYEKQGVKRKKVMHCRGAVPKGRIFTWEDRIAFNYVQYILMHSAIYKTEVVRKSGVVLPKHTFYVDTVFVVTPMPMVETMYYLDVDLYRYFIGRESQSVNEKVMMKRIDQQLFVNRILVDNYSKSLIRYKNLDRCMRHHIEVITAVSSTFLLLIGTKEALQKKKEVWKYIEVENPELYKKLRRRPLSFVTCLPGRPGRRIYLLGYKIFQKFLGFN